MSTRSDSESWAVILGSELRGAIAAHGRTIGDIADALEIERATLSRWLHGRRPMQAWVVEGIAIEIGEAVAELVARADRRYGADRRQREDPRGRLTTSPPVGR
jgi:transcriptional regulator with XRE-family HTH domain